MEGMTVKLPANTRNFYVDKKKGQSEKWDNNRQSQRKYN